MSANLDDIQLAAWRAFLNAHAAVINQIERELMTAERMPLTWYDVLVALADAPGQRLRLHELATAIVLSRSGLTRLVDRLERAGFLRREPCSTDRRGAYAALTHDGALALADTWPVYADAIATRFAGHLSNTEAQTLATALERVSNANRGQ